MKRILLIDYMNICDYGYIWTEKNAPDLQQKILRKAIAENSIIGKNRLTTEM